MGDDRLTDENRKHARSEIEGAIAQVIHRLAGHVEDHEGDTGGCHRAAKVVLGMFPADVVGAREDLSELFEMCQVVKAERDAAISENTMLRATVNACEAMLKGGVETRS